MDRGILFRESEGQKRKLPEYVTPYHLILLFKNSLKPWLNMPEKSSLYLKRLVELEKDVDLKVKDLTYCSDFHLLLYVEALQNESDMKDFDVYNQTITKLDEPKQFQIYIEGLAEERPSVKINDFVKITDTVTEEVYNLQVIRILREHIVAKGNERLSNEFVEDRLYDIKFVFNSFVFRCCHYALDLYSKVELKPYVFPVKSKKIDNPVNDWTKGLIWFNEAIENNPQQKQVVLNIVDKSNSFPAPYILYGPPGTGKTATFVEAICQVSKKTPRDRILVCTPSNTSADVIVKRLIKYIPKRDLHRMYSLAKDPFSIDEDILDCCNCVITISKDGSETREIVMFENFPKIIITTLCTSTRLLLLNFPKTDFPYIFIDEAGQATEPETLIPFSLLSRVRKERKIILAGDPQQLGPVIKSTAARSVLGKSMLERLMISEPYRRYNNAYDPKYITKLTLNYRSHPALIHVSNKLFYNNELKPCNNDSLRKAEGYRILPNKNLPIMFKGELDGQEDQSHLSPSSYNEDEMNSVFYYTRLLIGSKLGKTIVKPEDIGVITPFTAQKIRIRLMLEENNLDDVEVGTIQLFQGKEKEIIILSTVRSKVFNYNGREHIGFLDDPRRFNVALTRAKSLFIVIGHSATLQVDFNWWFLLNYCCKNGAYVGKLIGFRLKLESEFKREKPKKKKYNKKKPSNSTKISDDSTTATNKNFSLATRNRYSVLRNETLRLMNIESSEIADESNPCHERNCQKSNVIANTMLSSTIVAKTSIDEDPVSKLLKILKKTTCNIL